MLNPEYVKLREKQFADGYVVVNDEKVLLSSLLGMDGQRLYDEKTIAEIIGESDMEGISEKSFKNVEKTIKSMYSQLSMGIAPKFSTLFYLGKHAQLDNLAYMLLATAYLGGLELAPLLTPARLQRVQQKDDFEDIYLKTKVAVMLLPAGSSVRDIEQIRGYMQQRALYNNATLVLLGSFAMEKYILLNLCTVDKVRHDLGTLVGVTYEKPLTQEDIKNQYERVIEVTNDGHATTFDPEDSQYGGLRKQTQDKASSNYMSKFKELNKDT